MRNVYDAGDLVRILDASNIGLSTDYNLGDGDIARVTEGNRDNPSRGVRILKVGEPRAGLQGLYVYAKELQFIEPAKKSRYVVELEEKLTYSIEVEAIDGEEAENTALASERFVSSDCDGRDTRVVSVSSLSNYVAEKEYGAFTHIVKDGRGNAVAGFDSQEQAEAYAKFLKEAEES